MIRKRQLVLIKTVDPVVLILITHRLDLLVGDIRLLLRLQNLLKHTDVHVHVLQVKQICGQVDPQTHFLVGKNEEEQTQNIHCFSPKSIEHIHRVECEHIGPYTVYCVCTVSYISFHKPQYEITR